MKLLLSSTLLALGAAVTASPTVTVDAGTIQGGKCGDGQDAVFYKGVPFAQPPVGELRFQAPKSYSGKYPNGVLDATTHAANCIQFGTSTVPPGAKSEDCLYLDIWTPSNATADSKLPVKVWVFGGSDIEGGIDYPLYDGCNIVDDGSILVSVNYRLGPLGFMALKSAGIQGNQGIQDIVLGLEWVQKQISAFGGDPEKVVLFGQSAGATDVYTVATLPQAPSLMNSVIVESVALPSLIEYSQLQKTSASFARQLHCGVSNTSCLLSKNTTELQNANNADGYLNEGLGSVNTIGVSSGKSHKFYPSVDGTIISENPVTRGVQVPAIFGYNQKEGLLNTLTWFDNVDHYAPLNESDYTTFLQGNFGSAARRLIEKYYPYSLFKAEYGSTELAVLGAISTIITDSTYKCGGYQIAEHAARKNVSAWIYEFTHNSTCSWLNTIPQDTVTDFYACHTAEIPYVFGNLHFNFTNQNETCTATEAEHNLSNQMRSLWTSMAENGNPSTDEIHWPEFELVANGTGIPGLRFGNSSEPASLDFSVCKMWGQVNTLVTAANATTGMSPSATHSASSVASTASQFSGAGTISSPTGAFGVWGIFLAIASAFTYMSM
ncbi:hypothetical protein N7456_000016 [Penicillium angulare]|uniref:Carboxylic ester hydrolase n=1 Tax=Penicillium angulare TaxID=116970 RepID=A0A9W9KRH6_9EURO|nr:hypothetical protein N7456_000016 [Penicillium angulare]